MLRSHGHSPRRGTAACPDLSRWMPGERGNRGSKESKLGREGLRACSDFRNSGTLHCRLC
jgi:hypothetical protein